MKRFQRSSLHLLRHGAVEIVGRCTFDRLELETADAIELGFIQPVEQEFEICFCLARKADNESRAQRQARADFAPVPDAVEGLLLRSRDASCA